MKTKNDCERDYIKEAFDKLYNRVMPFIDLRQFNDADTAFKELDKKVHSEIYILKKCLAESDRAVDAGLVRSRVDRERISDLEEQLVQAKQRLNHERKHGEDLADINGQLASENVNLKAKISHAVKDVTDLKKKIDELEAEATRLKEAYDVQETTIKKENVDLSYGHEFEFGDEVFVPLSDAPYMYVKTGLLYNTRTKRLVYVGKDQHLKWFGEKFAIV